MTTHERAPSKRTRRSAKAAGSSFERSVADYLAAAISQLTGLESHIDRRVKTGAKDRGDIAGVRRLTTADNAIPVLARRVVVECKNSAVTSLPAWIAEAEIERGNDDALAGVVVHKRHGVADPARQWVSMELATLVALLTGERPEQLVAVDDTRDARQALYGDAGRQQSA